MLSSLAADSCLVAKPLPDYRSRIVGSVETLDWRLPEDRARACHLLQEHARSSNQGPKAPLLIKNAVSHWPALTKWDLQTLKTSHADQRVLVRCAPTMKFYYVETALLPLWRRLNSLCFRQPLPPTQQVFMPVSEFADRMQSGCQLPHCVYPEDGPEYYYMQSQLARAMLQDVDLYSPPLSCLGRPGLAGSAGQGAQLQPAGLPIAQIPRVFVSPAGAISPLHYDTATSFLAQIRGRKRLIFYPPEDLPSLYMHSRWSILRRRSKVDPANPNLAKYPKFKKLGGLQAVLEPGDILWFPGFWSHYTESVDFSVSMTYRFWNQEQAQAMQKS